MWKSRAAILAAAMLAIAASEPTTETRKFYVNDLSTNDTGTSTPTSGGTPVSCNRDDLYLAVKCSGDADSTYQQIGDTALVLTCDQTDAGITWRANVDRDYKATIKWSCPLAEAQATYPAVTSTAQDVTLSGTLSLCTNHNISSRSQCIYRDG